MYVCMYVCRESGFRIRETSGIRNAENITTAIQIATSRNPTRCIQFCNNVLYGAFEMTYYIVIFCKYSQFSEYEDYLKCQV